MNSRSGNLGGLEWPRLKVFCFSKENPTGHSEREKKKRQTEKEVGRQY